MRDVTICYGMTETSPVSFQTCTEGELCWAVPTGMQLLAADLNGNLRSAVWVL